MSIEKSKSRVVVQKNLDEASKSANPRKLKICAQIWDEILSQ
jgi:hypothetical protein